METDCLVLDEPTAMLDPQGRKEVMGVVERLHREKGLTVVLITHFMAEAMQAQRVVMVVSGAAKAEIVRQAFLGPVTPKVPASILQLHSDFTLVVDAEAGSLL
jgi:energy-coupling factor transporter ATP-binding protein EcfA2